MSVYRTIGPLVFHDVAHILTDSDVRERKTRSSMDVRSETDYRSGQRTPVSRRKKFFESFRRKFRSKSKDRNQNVKNLSRSQPNILHSTPNSYVDLDEYDHEPSGYHSRLYHSERHHSERDSFDDRFNDPTVTPVRSRSQSQNTRTALKKQTSEFSSTSYNSESPVTHRKFPQQSSFSDTSLTPPPGPRTQSQPYTSGEDWDREENDSAIEVVEVSQNTQEVGDFGLYEPLISGENLSSGVQPGQTQTRLRSHRR